MDIVKDKEKVAKRLAQIHFDVEPGLTHVFRILGSSAEESNPVEPIKLLEVNKRTIPTGIMPLQFDQDDSRGIPYPSIIVEITPTELKEIQAEQLSLPEGWSLGEPIRKPRKRA